MTQGDQREVEGPRGNPPTLLRGLCEDQVHEVIIYRAGGGDLVGIPQLPRPAD